jgi:hypothetical protein
MSPLHAPASAPASAAALPVSQLLGRALNQALREAAAPDTTERPALLVAAAPKALGLQALAARHPGGSQAQRQALVLYTSCLQHYRQRVQPRIGAAGPQGTADDLGCAAAYFVLSNLAVLEGREPDPVALPAVERQLRRLLAATAEWARVPLAERQQSFEQLAALAVLVNESRLAALVQGPAAAQHLRQASHDYLQQMLGLQAERLTVSAAGLAWAEGVQ